MPLLEVEALFAGYGRIPVLRDVSLTVDRGEIVCVLGANGAGKTTLVNTIAGILRPSSGSIEFDGADATTLVPEARAVRGLALVRQGRSVFPYMTVEENLELGAYVLGDRRAYRTRLEAAFELFPVLATRRRQLAGSMSGGEQKMLEIARSLMSPRKLLMLDEPSLGLAPIVVDAIFQRIRTLSRDGLAILLVEQNALGALQIADRGYVLELGRIRLHDTAQRLLSTAEIRAAYLGIGSS